MSLLKYGAANLLLVVQADEHLLLPGDAEVLLK